MAVVYDVDYEKCKIALKTLIKRYRTARRANNWDYWEFQDIRDEIAELMIDFGDYAADVRANADQAEANRKAYHEERKAHHRKVLGGTRGSATAAESKAMEDVKPYYDAEVEAKRQWFKCQQIIQRVSDLQHSIAGRTKGMLAEEGSTQKKD